MRKSILIAILVTGLMIISGAVLSNNNRPLTVSSFSSITLH